MAQGKNGIKEYEDLRNEIKQKIELHNSLITVMITAVVAVLAFAVEKDKALLYLLPFGIIIPISMRIAYYRSVMAKISAYIIVYLENEIEDLKWETRNFDYVNENKDSLNDKLTISHYYEGLILSLVCYLLFFLNYSQNNSFNSRSITVIFISFFLVIWEFIITMKIARVNKERKNWKDRWEKFKNCN